MSGFIKTLMCIFVFTLFLIIAPKEFIVEDNIDTKDFKPNYIDLGLSFFSINNSKNDDCDIKVKQSNYFKTIYKINTIIDNKINEPIYDSNGNPIVNNAYIKAVYYVFHPDDRFG